MHFRSIFVAAALLVSQSLAAPAHKTAVEAGLLPARFAGWKLVDGKTGTDPAVADPVNAALLKEYGFTEFENATYAEDGRTLKLRAARFADSNGAFGAFTYYAQPGMESAQIGDRCVASAAHILFQRGTTIVDALFSQPTAMSAAELRELAAEFPVERTSDSEAPETASYLPSKGLQPNTLRYVVGPVGLAAIGAPVPANVVDFARSGEVAVAEYQTSQGEAQLGVVNFPTPQIASEQQKVMAGLFPNAPRDPASLEGTIAVVDSDGNNVAFRRSGPLLIFVRGASSLDAAKGLAQRVNYNAMVTWNAPPPTAVSGVVKLVIYSLVFALMLIAGYLVLVIFLGGGYVALHKFFPGLKLPSQDRELIRLNLKE